MTAEATLHDNLIEVVTLVLEDEDPKPETEFVGRDKTDR